MRRMSSLLIAITLTACVHATGSVGPALQARHALDAFLQLEFEGEPDARYTDALMSDPMPGGHADGHVLDLDARDLDLIASYRIGPITQDDARYCAEVSFQLLAHARGSGAWDRGISAADATQSERYCMVETEGGWRTIDPGMPRVSPAAVARFIRERIAAVEAIRARQSLSASQHRYHASLERQLQELGELRTNAHEAFDARLPSTPTGVQQE